VSDAASSPEAMANWVMVGLLDSDGCLVLASDKLTAADLTRKIEGYQEVPVPSVRRRAKIPVFKSRLVVEYVDFVMIRGKSYAACLATIAEVWRPREPGEYEGGGSS
jgi:hypothetical protein